MNAEIKMGKSFRLMTLTSAIGLALAGAGMQSSTNVQAADIAPAAAAAQANGSEKYIVTFAEDGLLDYTGSVNGLQATAPKAVGTRKLDTRSAAAQAYDAYLAAQRENHRLAIESVLGRPLAVTHSYSVTLNGIAADMTAAEAAGIAGLPGVKSVAPAGVEQLVTYRGPEFIGADKIWDGTATPTHTGTMGEGVVVGDLDGGTNSDHPSFANDPVCGFSANEPKLVAKDCSTSSGGLCTGPNPEANPGFGHGVHTSSTIAGNTLDNTAVPAPALPDGITMSGVAPCAAIRHYKVCQTNSCGGADILAGVQNAITDQVDVLNFSISGGTSPWNDNDRNFLDAVHADVFVAAAAGNNTTADPVVVGRVNHRGPWVMTVAASTQDEIIGPSMSMVAPGSPPASVIGIPLNPGSTTPASETPTYSGHPVKSDPANIAGCTDTGGFAAGYFTGAIALVRRGASQAGGTACTFTEKITNAFNAGADMVVIANNQIGSISMDTTGAPDVPAFSIGSVVTGDALIAFVAADEANSAADVAPIAVANTQGDVLADFSYRGPTPAPLADETKPDISAPGVNIYAALDDSDGNYGFMSGTSMATPHVTGAGALVRAVHPAWSVTEVKSAMMMTATNANGVHEDGTTPWNIDDVGSGRVDLTKAALAGLTMDETYENFLAANPSGGSIDIKTLNVPALRNLACTPDCSWTRTVKNQLATPGTWQVTSSTGTGSGTSFAVVASPANFTLAPGETRTITFTATPNGDVTAIAFGNVILHEAAGQAPDQHITMAVEGEGVDLGDVIFRDGFDVDNGQGSVVQDPSFEATTADGGSNPFWQGSDTNPNADPGATPFYSADGSQIPVRTGNWAIWFGGWAGGAEIQDVSQTVTMPNGGPSFLNYWRLLETAPDAPGTLTVSVDGVAVETTDLSAVSADADYTQQSVDISSYANGAPHLVRFEYAYDDAGGTGGDGNVFVDDVTIDPTAASPMQHGRPAVHPAAGLRKRAR
jgi:subtilisin family serine protease